VLSAACFVASAIGMVLSGPASHPGCCAGLTCPTGGSGLFRGGRDDISALVVEVTFFHFSFLFFFLAVNLVQLLMRLRRFFLASRNAV